MRLPFLAPLLALCLAAPAGAATNDMGTAAQVQWLKVLLQGQQIGHVVHTRREIGDTVINSERFEASLARAGTPLSIVTEETHRESRSGVPLGFATLTDLGGVVQHSEGAIAADGALSMIFSQGKDVRTQEARYPAGALLTEGARLLEDKSALDPGQTIHYSAFVPSQMDAVKISLRYIGEEDIVVAGKHYTARHSEQTLALAGGDMRIQSWSDADGRVLRSLTPMFGMEFEMLATDAQAATHRDAGTDLFAMTIVRAPRALSAEERQADLRYTLAFKDDAIARSLPGDEQHLSPENGAWHLLVDAPPYLAAADAGAPDPANTRGSAWVQSDAPELVAFARSATAGDKDARTRMTHLQTAVSLHIKHKNLRVGYASALEALRTREGDCTEHALLLAAAGRALKVPTRVVVGLAYVAQFAGQQQAFVPHAWVQAWLGDRWESFDAALGGFDSGHIALATGDGDPGTFFGSINLLGNLSIQAIERADR